MPSTTRRAVLRAAAGLSGALTLAGCDTRRDRGPPLTPTRREGRLPDGAVTDPATVTLRNPAFAPVVTQETDSADETDPDGDGATEARRSLVVGDAETAASLVFADGVDGVDRARELLAGTDFETESVYVEQRVVRECYETELCWVLVTQSSIQTEYATRLRPAEVACDADGRDVVADLIRLPAAVTDSQIRQYKSSTGSHHCRPPEEESA